MYIYIIMSVFVFFCILFFTTITIQIKILKDKTNDKIILSFKTLFGILKYKIEIPFVDLNVKKNGIPFLKLDAKIKNNEDDNLVKEDESIITFKEMQRIQIKLKHFWELYFHIVNYLRKKIKIDYLLWITEFGIEDAAVTAILSGVFWMIKGNLMVIIKNNVKCNKIILNVVPQFGKQIFKTTLNCIISIKIGYIIIAAIKFGYTFLRKGGVGNGKSSNRSINENNNGKFKRYGRCKYNCRRPC
ncbi:DUF2953 domain-containing protein [Crassaminicella thermophila]|uniref:DUF2953 domain-containing protein n=1 Tax=Crassaminicella thermophila TaxID=2599308 RepID=UPI00143DF8EE|nr:DUF2953 domain-containing protein [Crassaminicella thermophila]